MPWKIPACTACHWMLHYYVVWWNKSLRCLHRKLWIYASSMLSFGKHGLKLYVQFYRGYSGFVHDSVTEYTNYFGLKCCFQKFVRCKIFFILSIFTCIFLYENTNISVLTATTSILTFLWLLFLMFVLSHVYNCYFWHNKLKHNRSHYLKWCKKMLAALKLQWSNIISRDMQRVEHS